jgi:pentatricopeptide repeat protein
MSFLSFGNQESIYDLTSLTWDIAIFVVTIVAARLFTSVLSKQGAPQKLKGEGLKELKVSSKQKAVSAHYASAATADEDATTVPNVASDLPSLEWPSDIYEEAVVVMQEWQGGNVNLGNRILGLYADLRQSLSRSKQTLAEVGARSRQKPLYFYSMLLRLVIRTGKHNLVEPIIDDMAKQGVQRTVNFYESVMKQLAAQKLFAQALRINDRVGQDGLEVSADSCSCLVRFAAEVGDLQQAVEFFMKLSSMSTPSIRAYMTILGVHNKRQDWQATLATVKDMRSKGVHVDGLTLNVALSTGVSAEEVEDVELLLKEAESKEPFSPDVISYNTLMKVFAQRSMYVQAAQVVERMKKFNIRPDVITFNTVMDAAVRAGQFSEAWDVLTDMRLHGLKPDKYTCLILVKSVSKSMSIPSEGEATINRALVLLKSVDRSLEPSLRASLYYSVIESTLQAGRAAMLSKVVAQMQSHNVALTPTLQKSIDQALRRRS